MTDATPVLLATLGNIESAASPSMLALVTEADIIVKLVLFVLLAMSVACWMIIFSKLKSLREAERTSAAFLERFWQSRRIDQVYDQIDTFKGSPVAMVFKAGYTELAKLSARDSNGPGGIAISGEDNLTRALRRARTVERTSLQKLTTFLATTGSTAPFIGLFGTVWGILRAFQKIDATGQATVATVGGDIAHALIATAVGLAAAIPAVIAFNFFNSRIRVLATEMDNFSDDFLNIVKRHRQTS